MLSTIKNLLVLNIKEDDIKEISNNMVNNLVSYWEALYPKNNQSGKDIKMINEFPASVVLKLTRNWKMHNLIRNVDFSFMYFIFSLSVRLLGHDENREIQAFILSELIAVKLPEEDKIMSSGINAKDIFVSINKKLNKDRTMYVQDLYKLYDEFGRDPLKKSSISIEDIYEVFYLCLHFPYIDGEEVKFVEDDCEKKDALSKKLEQMVNEKILQKSERWKYNSSL